MPSGRRSDTGTSSEHALPTGVRVSLELGEAGTCVGEVTQAGRNSVALRLLDDVSGDELPVGLTLDMFLARPEGIYHWLCAVSSPVDGERALLDVLGEPTFVQRRVSPRVESWLEVQVRRVRSGRRSPSRAAVVVDLGRGGMKLQGPFQGETADTVEVSVDLGRRVTLLGRVVMAHTLAEGTWVTHVSFLPGQRDTLEALDSYIARRLRERGP